MKQNVKEQDYLYEQGIANLRLEGMNLDSEQDRLARMYLAGELNKKQLLQEALEYARSQ